ncbi:MAG TPA: PDDEXK nuclease domain-containing protein [Pedobacter sp.]|jgi:predicted nuclease of restriction endonuclease-like (RecB) superfamily
MPDINELVFLISETQKYFQQQAQRQVNTALTMRNWLFGFYIAEYELNGADRAEYGQRILKELAQRAMHISGMSERNLYLFKTFYLAYPNILQSVTAKLYLSEFQKFNILQSVTAKLITAQNPAATAPQRTDINKLLNQLSFTHIIELLKADTELKRNFYELEALKNNWSVRELQRAMNSMLFERTGLSTNKQAVLEKHHNQERLLPEDVFRNPFVLEFLGLKEEAEYSESDLEQAIINHLQTFLLEMGRGFCFEARQKRITFDNTHYRIDLVFYHRILKCNVLIDLKLGEFSHADAGQMNVYLNYYNENETNEGDNPPIGIILCASKNESLVKYSTAGLPQQVFVNKYMINLPKEEELRKIIEEEQQKLQAKL